jgi:CRISPR/Cas system type I-B associated protein Csh2 (Cas7 group RAMP superfamily)
MIKELGILHPYASSLSLSAPSRRLHSIECTLKLHDDNISAALDIDSVGNAYTHGKSNNIPETVGGPIAFDCASTISLISITPS